MLKVHCLNKDYNTLIDSGHSHNFISQQTYDQLRQIQKGFDAVEVEQATGDRLQIVLTDRTSTESRNRTRIKLILENGRCMHVQCNIVPFLAQQTVFGMLFLLATNPQIDWQSYVINITSRNVVQAVPVALDCSRPSQQEITAKTAVRLAKQQGSGAWFALIRSPKNVQTGLLASPSGSSESLVAAPPQFQSLVQQYSDFFAEPCELAPGQKTHRIELHNKSLMPPRQWAYKMSPAEIAEAQCQVDNILEKGWIRPSLSPYGALLLFVHKKSGELRMCIEYRLLNKQTRLDRFPIPQIDDLLDKLANATVFSKIDLSNAYYQVQIEEGHQFKTAFQTSFGLYELVLLPLGLYNATATFQHLLHNVFPASQHDLVIVYLDHILIFSRNRDEHYEHVKYVLEQLRFYGLKAKAKKTELCLEQVEYLGHIVQNGTGQADPSKVTAVAEWPVPSDIK